jgi:hypothetical protein
MLTVALLASAALSVTSLPIQGLHLSAPDSGSVAACADFIRTSLPKEGVNTLVMEFDYHYRFKTHPEVAESGALSNAEVKRIVRACRDAHVHLIPQINLLGHQSWAETTDGLLRSHPEFDETRGKYPGNKGIYCRSYCPLAPGVHRIVFDLMDELADACESDAFHCGMDEVMILADKDCPRCHGKQTADLFAGEVKALHDHLRAKGRKMWMWGDRFIDGNTTGIGEWEASGNNTASAIARVPKDIVVCDWHYDQAVPTAAYFAMAGMPVVSCPWHNSQVALDELAQIRYIRGKTNEVLAERARGVMVTTWVDFSDFLRAYKGDTSASRDARESARCFKALYSALRAQ